jgi:L-aminopeptidase/D-esterase-like protein
MRFAFPPYGYGLRKMDNEFTKSLYYKSHSLQAHCFIQKLIKPLKIPRIQSISTYSSNQRCRQGCSIISVTTLAVVATDAALSKEGANKMAQMAHDGLAQAIRPIHTMVDGDTVFALATGQQTKVPVNVSVVGAVAAAVLAEAVVRAVIQATSLAAIPAARDLL